ncbi:MAG TPA: hypothetical protein VFJ82_20220, partial [Longimicrobium sp.]|nr:hypothetical protein [Longimicrobium sp.]
GGDEASALALLARVRARLDAGLMLSAGVVEYSPALTSADELLAAADRKLYHAKQRAHGPLHLEPRMDDP